jgi:hypothetical protein
VLGKFGELIGDAEEEVSTYGDGGDGGGGGREDVLRTAMVKKKVRWYSEG